MKRWPGCGRNTSRRSPACRAGASPAESCDVRFNLPARLGAKTSHRRTTPPAGSPTNHLPARATTPCQTACRRWRCRRGPWSRLPRWPRGNRRSCPSTVAAGPRRSPSPAGRATAAVARSTVGRAPGSGWNGAMPISPAMSSRPSASSSSIRTTMPSGEKPNLLASPATLTSSSTVGRWLSSSAIRSNCSRQFQRIDAVEQLEKRQRRPDFVLLQVPDEMPARPRRQQGNLGLGFLHAAFAEEELPGIQHLAHRFRRVRLGNRHQFDLVGRAAGPSRRLGDLFPDLGQPFHKGVCH